jgi:cobalt/nickel transport system permease protein
VRADLGRVGLAPERVIADPRLRIVAVLVLAFSFSALHEPLPLALMVVLTVVLVRLAGVGFGSLAPRLRLPGVIVAALVAVLPFTSGETVLASIGPVTFRAEGTAAALGIAVRFLCIFTLVVLFLGALPMPRLIGALRGLGLPALIVDMALLTLRHIEDLRCDLARMQVAMRLRGAPRGFWRGRFRATGWALASLLLRSHARSERVYHAMILRGHGAPGAAPPEAVAWSRADGLWLTAVASAAALLVAIEQLA